MKTMYLSQQEKTVAVRLPLVFVQESQMESISIIGLPYHIWNTCNKSRYQGDSITFSTPTIEGTIYRRNKVDGKNQHPWKAEANEGDTSLTAAVIDSWFDAVYEPSYTGEAE